MQPPSPSNRHILRRKKRTRAGQAEGADGCSKNGRAVGLGAIFHNPQRVFFGDGRDRMHIRGMSVEMDGNYSDRARGDY